MNRNDDMGLLENQKCNFISSLLNEFYPLECEVVGETTVSAIVGGAKFTESQGGRNTGLVEVIGFLGAIASLAQLGIQLLEYSKKHDKTEKAPIESQEIADKSTLLLEQIIKNGKYKNIIDGDKDRALKICRHIIIWKKGMDE